MKLNTMQQKLVYLRLNGQKPLEQLIYQLVNSRRFYRTVEVEAWKIAQCSTLSRKFWKNFKMYISIIRPMQIQNLTEKKQHIKG